MTRDIAPPAPRGRLASAVGSMHMGTTIRDHIKRRVRIIAALAISGWLLVPLSASFGADPHAFPLPMFLGFAIFAGAILGLTFFVRCPKCNSRFGQVASQIAFHFGSTRGRVNFCPYCGTSLDEPYEPPRKVL